MGGTCYPFFKGFVIILVGILSTIIEGFNYDTVSYIYSSPNAGDLRVAMETLLTAIAIIKQSRVYTDERCQALVTSLKDCLVSIQGNGGYRFV